MDYHTETAKDQYSTPEYSLFLWLARPSAGQQVDALEPINAVLTCLWRKKKKKYTWSCFFEQTSHLLTLV